MGEARRRAQAGQSSDIRIDGWSRLPGLAVEPSEVASAPAWINPDRIAHMQALHPVGSKGLVTLMRRVATKEFGWRWKSVAVAPEDLATCPDLQLASHASVNRFYGLRRARGLKAINAVMADVDYHSCARHKHRAPEEMMRMMDERLAAAGIPSPSYWIYSGRGICAIWLLHELPRGAAPRVKALQRALLGPKQDEHGVVFTAGRQRPMDEREARNAVRMAEVWRGVGLDRSASDVARVFRIAGGTNEKSQQRVRLLWPASWDVVRRYDIDELADAVLPYTRAEIAAFRAERQAQRAGIEALRQDRADRRGDEDEIATAVPMRVPNAGRARLAGGGQWQRRVDALFRIREHWGGTPPQGARELWAYHLACAYGNLERGDLASWSREIAPLSGVPQGELQTSLGTVYAKMLAHQRGEMSEWKGQPRDIRYTPSHAEVIDELGLTAEDLATAGVDYMLRGAGALTATQRSAERRRREGAEVRTVQVEKRHADGISAHALRAAGKTMKEIAAALGRGITSLTRAMAETADRIGRAVEAVADAVVEAVQPPALALSTIHDSARHLVAGPFKAVRPLAARSEIAPFRSIRHPETGKPMPDVPSTPTTRRFVPIIRPRVVPVPWAARSPVVPASVSLPSVVKATRSRLSSITPSVTVNEPVQAAQGRSFAATIVEADGPRVTIVAVRPGYPGRKAA